MDEAFDTAIQGIEQRLSSFNYRSWRAVDYELTDEGASVVEVSQEPPSPDTVIKGKIICRNLDSAELAILIANAPYDISLLLSKLRAEKLISSTAKKKIELLQDQLQERVDKYSTVVELLKASGERETKLQKKLDRRSPKSRAKKAKKK